METSVLSGLELTKWQRKFIRAYVRGSGFEPYMGDSELNIIHVRNDLETDGYKIRVPLLLDLRSDGVTGNQKLSGNEEPMDQYYFDVSWEYYRHGIETSKKEREKSAQDLLSEKEPLLQNWASEKIKYQIVDTFHSMNGVKYSEAEEVAHKDAWLSGNRDRVLFGNAISNHSSLDHSASLGQIDTSADKVTAVTVQLLKRRARMAYPRIRPYKTKSGRDYYVWFMHPRCFRDAWNDNAIYAANKDARAREGDGMNDNPIFQDGDLIYKGVIMREIPEFEVARNSSDVNPETTLVGAGNSCDVGVGFFCGAQAVSYVNKQLAKPTAKKETDYDFFKGVGIEMAHGIEKTRWANNTTGALTAAKDFGIVTTYHAAVADA